MADRSTRREVRNPLVALPGFGLLLDQPADVRVALGAALRSIQADARDRAEKAWRTHKGPMALYWKAVSVYAGHLARIIEKGREQN
jgi:hypothetical protein